MVQPLDKDQILGQPLIVSSMSSPDANGTLILDNYTMVLFAITLLQLEESALLDNHMLILMEWASMF